MYFMYLMYGERDSPLHLSQPLSSGLRPSMRREIHRK